MLTLINPKLARIGKGADRWIALTNGVFGNGRVLYRAVVDADLESIVVKRPSDAYHPKLGRWHKILNRACSQRRGRAEWVSRAGGATLGADETTDAP
jgi:hypothetical protein